jgi:hypothetical protein
MIKVKRNTNEGEKTYEYDMKALWISEAIHTELKSISQDESLPMGRMILKMMKEYKKK